MELTSSTQSIVRSGHIARMPQFAEGTYAHAHSIHSALASLTALGIRTHRIIIRRTGRESVIPGTVVRQWPPADAPILPDTLVYLDIAGLGFTHALPVGMWDSGGETHAGTREILEPFDDPLEKLKHWFHEGAPLFHIAPDDLAACMRWLQLFGMDADEWPRELWYSLASLIASVPELSCSQDGCKFVLSALLDLPVQNFSYRPSLTALPQASLSYLGTQASRLGIDLLIGDSVEDFAVLEVEVGPVPLETYEYYSENEKGIWLLGRTLEMIMPVSTNYDIRWCVLDRNRAPQLGMREHNARLGINTYMGGTLATEEIDLELITENHTSLESGRWSNA
jgi:hypothetical protein